ncbi:MAG: methyltransferase domain-containing protein [Rickettsiales bacterium]
MSTAIPKEYKTDVREQYEDFPYPFRDVNDEGTLFHASDPQSLMALSHAGWGGKRDLRGGTRFLNAGCGTGDSTVMLAEELLGADSDIVSIDLSTKSLEIAQARLTKRGLMRAHTQFHHLSILDLPSSGLGQFDVIECSGVLHHLPDPAAGLRALVSMLKPDGMLVIMVYGQHGRLSVYMVQELMKHLIAQGTPRAEKIAIAREFLNNVPMGHWLTVNNELFLADLRWPDGSGIYDLFLHSTDRAYTVPQIYDWVEGAGLHWLEFFGSHTDHAQYTPENYTISPTLRTIVAKKPPREREHIAELMNGNIGKHYFYAAPQAHTPAMFADDMVMDYGLMQHFFLGFLEPLRKGLEAAPIGTQLDGQARPFPGAPDVRITKTKHVVALLAKIDGERSIGDMVAQVAAETHASPEEVRRDLEQLYAEFRSRQLVFLRHQSIARYRNLTDISTRVKHHVNSQKP